MSLFNSPQEIRVHSCITLSKEIKDLMIKRVGSRNLSATIEQLCKAYLLAGDPNAESCHDIDKSIREAESEIMKQIAIKAQLKLKKRELMKQFIPIEI